MTPEQAAEALNVHIMDLVALAEKRGQHMALANVSHLLLMDEQAGVPVSMPRVIAHISTVSKEAGDVTD